MQEEGVVALLGLVLMTTEDREIRVPAEVLEAGLPPNSSVEVFKDELTDELIVRIGARREVE